MKSPMVQNAGYIPADEKGQYSDLQVLQSGAGFYIGTLFTNKEGPVEFTEPGSRDTEYFATREEAEAELKRIESGESQTTRMEP